MADQTPRSAHRSSSSPRRGRDRALPYFPRATHLCVTNLGLRNHVCSLMGEDLFLFDGFQNRSLHIGEGGLVLKRVGDNVADIVASCFRDIPLSVWIRY